jgi:photosystem II stability/assembly factor-like uncharacterized protein
MKVEEAKQLDEETEVVVVGISNAGIYAKVGDVGTLRDVNDTGSCWVHFPYLNDSWYFDASELEVADNDAGETLRQSINDATPADWDEATRVINQNMRAVTQSGTPLDTQVGGDHYSSMSIQPVQYIVANELGFCEGNAIKYLSRWKSKGGVEDLQKAKHFIDMLIEQVEHRA